MRRLPAPALLLVAALLAGCSSAGAATPGPEPAAATAAPAGSVQPVEQNPYGASPVDPPAPGEPILDVRGGRKDVALSLAQLEDLGTVDVTIEEPFVKQEQDFTAVPLARVLDAGGIPASAELLTIALNDYRYSAPAASLTGSQALIATRLHGEAIPYDQGGPIRLIFPDGTPLADDLDAWNWSLAEIRGQ